ncbi:MAG: hypothetical protein LBC38_02255, partial [Oscillospiraceae bacterium]|nr:hypothetical protein [Oscillospiraceae bacterium]
MRPASAVLCYVRQMTIYFIDYENVGAAGLQGINRLTEGDLVVVFHGINSGSISFDLHVQIFSSLATVEYIRTAKSAKNYLDFQLTTYLGYQVANSNASDFIIVSRDAGFDSVIDFWRARTGRRTFKRQWSIGTASASTANVVKLGTTAEVAPAIAEVAPAIAEIAPAVAEVAPAIAEIAPAVAEVVPAVAEVAPAVAAVAPSIAAVAPAIAEVAPAVAEEPKKRRGGRRKATTEESAVASEKPKTAPAAKKTASA